MSKILIVEDEPRLRRSIRELLTRHGYEVLTASGCAEAVQLGRSAAEVDLYLVDVWLPDGDGFEACRRIRKYSTKPILFLTACDDEESVVRGLDIGADDYITKPFRTAELLSRIQANLRRQTMERQADMLRSGEILLDRAQEKAYKDGKDMALGKIEYQLLQMLMSHAGNILKREQLLEELWDSAGNYVEDNTLSVNMSRLRGKIGQEYIETMRGVGYRFAKPVRFGLE